MTFPTIEFEEGNDHTAVNAVLQGGLASVVVRLVDDDGDTMDGEIVEADQDGVRFYPCHPENNRLVLSNPMRILWDDLVTIRVLSGAT